MCLFSISAQDSGPHQHMARDAYEELWFYQEKKIVMLLQEVHMVIGMTGRDHLTCDP